jgi:hypothetical protein
VKYLYLLVLVSFGLTGCAHNDTCGSVGAAMMTGGASCLFKHDKDA